MVCPVDLAEVAAVDMGIDLRRGDDRMAEHFLNGGQIRAPLQQVSCERVPQRVGTDGFFDSRAVHVSSQDLPYPHPAQRLAPGIEKDPALPAPPLEPRAHLTKIERQGTDRASTDGYDPFLATLAVDNGYRSEEHTSELQSRE